MRFLALLQRSSLNIVSNKQKILIQLQKLISIELDKELVITDEWDGNRYDTALFSLVIFTERLRKTTNYLIYDGL
jgi:hypothetical protein